MTDLDKQILEIFHIMDDDQQDNFIEFLKALQELNEGENHGETNNRC